MTVAEFHENLTPPQSRASSNMIQAGVKNKKPGRSSLRKCPLRGTFVPSVILESGIRMKARIVAVMPPNGRFM